MELKRLGDIIKITSGGTPLTSKREYYDDGKIPWAKTGDLKVRHLSKIPDSISQLGLDNSSAKIFPINTVLIAMYGATIGNCSILKTSAATNQACAALLPNEEVNEEFLFFFLSSIKSELIKKGVGGGQPNISATILKDIKIPFPSLTDQIRIAQILTQAENLITQRKESISLLDELLKSTFLEMFGDPSFNQNKFPQGKIRDVVYEVKYGTGKPAEINGIYPYLRMNNITSNGYMDFSTLKYINLEKNEEPKYLVKKGDLLFNRTNSKELVGKTGIYNETSQMVIAGYLIRVRTNEKANPWFLWGYLNSLHGKKTLFSMCKSIVGMANINAQELQEIKIVIPPIELQNQFAAIVEKVETVKSEYQASLTELENMYGVLSQKAFKGELKVELENV
ncbi:restriction endonuclease subunit S [Flavobacterium sp. XS1P27]|uniref:restriction endonuclease subunit S n=1 Tax=Flavobacterium sp. XS1P27 TaxID=3401724 RepID=UPI003AAAD88F